MDLMMSMEILGIDVSKIGEYISKEEESFIDNVPVFPTLNDNVANINQDDSISGVYDKEKPYIPAFLPDLPDSRTYKNNVLYQKRQVKNVSLKNEDLKLKAGEIENDKHLNDIVSDQL